MSAQQYSALLPASASHSLTLSLTSNAVLLADGSPLEGEALDRVIASLKAIRNAQIMKECEAEAARLKWVWPERPREYAQTKSCVYLMRPMRPFRQGVHWRLAERWGELVKIGMTERSLTNRREAVNASYLGGVKVVAFAETTEPRRVESVLHHLFARYRVHGEWFIATSVLHYLKDDHHA